MKKLILSLIVLAFLGCQKEQIEPQGVEQSTVLITSED